MIAGKMTEAAAVAVAVAVPWAVLIPWPPRSNQKATGPGGVPPHMGVSHQMLVLCWFMLVYNGKSQNQMDVLGGTSLGNLHLVSDKVLECQKLMIAYSAIVLQLCGVGLPGPETRAENPATYQSPCQNATIWSSLRLFVQASMKLHLSSS